MLEFNTTEIIQTFQNLDYYYVLSNLIGITYLELLVFTMGMFFYAVFVWYFYKKLAKRDVFELNLGKYILKKRNKGYSSPSGLPICQLKEFRS